MDIDSQPDASSPIDWPETPPRREDGHEEEDTLERSNKVEEEDEQKWRRRGAEWKPWEDRALAKEIMAAGVLVAGKGKSIEKWEEVARALKKIGSIRTGKSSKSRFNKLLTELRAQNLRSLQKTGTNEEVTTFLYDMENLNSLAEIQSKDPQLRAQARERQKKLDEEGKLMRKEAMEGMSKTEVKSKKRKTMDDSIEEFERETLIYQQKIQKMEEEEATRHNELLNQNKETTQAIQHLCQLWEDERKEMREILCTLLERALEK
ncbi:hypothetical protein BDZ91DRAFT_847259 [Kalaharituber pfeilii]|nr:hypothetical protein BDZ91DRAFT_847259 [Kalaharituber pfeilii]